MASVGGDLLVESVQDKSRFNRKNVNAGASVSICIPPFCAGSSSVSGNIGGGKMNSNFDSVTEQSGLYAGDGGIQSSIGGGISTGGTNADLGTTQDT